MPRTKRVKSSAKQGAIMANSALSAWRTAAKEMGYLQKGAFKPIPAKGSTEYMRIKARQAELMGKPRMSESKAAAATPAPAAVPMPAAAAGAGMAAAQIVGGPIG